MGGGNPAPGGLAADDRQVLVRIICDDRYLLSAADEVLGRYHFPSDNDLGIFKS